MKKKEWNEGLNYLDSDLIEKHIEQKEKLRQKNKTTRGVWLRFGAIAACFLLIVSAVIVAPIVTPSDVPTWDDARYSAQDIAEQFGAKNYDAVTNAYTKVYVPDAKYLQIGELSDEEYLTIYQYNERKNFLNKNDFQNFINSFLPALADSITLDIPPYEIKEVKSYENFLEVYEYIGKYIMSITQHETANSFRLSVSSGSDDRKIVFDGETVQVDQRLDDEEIIDSVQSIKNKLFDIFNVSFADTKMIRRFDSYSQNGATSIYIYFYDESAHPLNKTQDEPISDYIFIAFDNFQNFDGDTVSDSILTVANISYIQNRVDVTEAYAIAANAKRISLEEAETLLYNGYVFGGHTCSLCMAAQDKISFEGYDYVDMEYVIGYNEETQKPTLAIPFYTFYKNIGTASNGNTIYAKTYVAAIQVRGYQEYFASQKENHRKN